MEIWDIVWQTMQEHIKENVKTSCNEYLNNPKYKVLKIEENGELKGFGVYHDYEGTRYIHEVHYIGSNKYVSIKFWKWFKKDAKKLMAICQKSNKTMIELYLRMKFKTVGSDLINNYLLKEVN